MRAGRNAQHPSVMSGSSKPNEHVEVSGPGLDALEPIPEAKDTNTPVTTSTVPAIGPAYTAGSAVDEGELAAAPRPKQYIITRGGQASDVSGTRARFHEGKIIDDHNYDIGRLKQQGIKLEPYEGDAS